MLHYFVTLLRLLEQFLCFLEEALAHGAFLAVAKLGKLMQLRLLILRKVSGHLDIDADVQIATAITLDILDAFAFQTKHCARLGARWDFDRGSPVQCWDIDFCAECCLHKAHRHFAQQIIAVALEDGMGLDVEHHIKIARRSAAKARFPITGGAQARAGVHTGGDTQLDFRRALTAAFPATGSAWLLEDAAGTLTMRTGLGDAEDTTRVDNLTAAAAAWTGPDAGTGFRA